MTFKSIYGIIIKQPEEGPDGKEEGEEASRLSSCLLLQQGSIERRKAGLAPAGEGQERQDLFTPSCEEEGAGPQGTEVS